jgi:hypothetical protein
MTDNSFEIPQTVRDRAEQNVKQAHAVYAQFAAFVTKAMDAWTGAMPSNFMTAVIKDVQGRAVEIARKNAEATFTFAGKISNAHTFQEILMLQTHFAQEQMRACMAQTQELPRLIGDAFQKLQGGKSLH